MSKSVVYESNEGDNTPKRAGSALESTRGFMYTPEFNRHFAEFVPGDTLMNLRLETMCWNAAADALIDKGVKSGEIIVHDGKCISFGTSKT
ncbi:hypothetical protein TrLO_g14705 [Triparma laevis f. longispina]|uniref:Uncharacterized protein n=1 Tax=Triparma laevis f. longispina TaxID=1714387 RepID=A0A9W7A940_9STRA|nr:hypothetical protein TrLO_g14705 [Triparma laevis f. longispina]